MSCQLSAQVQAYHDGELDATRAAQFEAHLPGCAGCQRDLKSLQALSDAIAASSPSAQVRMSYDALQRLHDEVDRTMDRSLLPLARSLIGVAAALLIIATAGLWRIQPPHASEPQAWEGAVLTSSSQQIESNGSGIDPEIIVADLSRPSMH